MSGRFIFTVISMFLLCAAFTSSTAWAGQGSGKVLKVWVFPTGPIGPGGPIASNRKPLFGFSTEYHTDRPACVVERFVVDLSTELGRQVAQVVKMQFMIGGHVHVHGMGECSLHSDSETAIWVVAE